MKTLNVILATAFVLALPLTSLAQTAETPAEPAKDESETTEVESMEENTHVARSTFTTEVVENEPVDELEAIPAEAETVCFFTEIVDLKGETITHRWTHQGEVVAEVPIEIGGPRWRVHSIKNLPESSSGIWTVQVVDSADTVLFESSIDIVGLDSGTAPSSSTSR